MKYDKRARLNELLQHHIIWNCLNSVHRNYSGLRTEFIKIKYYTEVDRFILYVAIAVYIVDLGRVILMDMFYKIVLANFLDNFVNKIRFFSIVLVIKIV